MQHITNTTATALTSEPSTIGSLQLTTQLKQKAVCILALGIDDLTSVTIRVKKVEIDRNAAGELIRFQVVEDKTEGHYGAPIEVIYTGENVTFKGYTSSPESKEILAGSMWIE